MKRANWLGAPAAYDLNQACRTVWDAFGGSVYLVGSCLTKRNHRDVDVRVILSDDEYARMFPGMGSTPSRDAFWSLLCTSISMWLSARSGLPVDFQIQQQTAANEEYPKQARHPIGFFLPRTRTATLKRKTPAQVKREKARATEKLLGEMARKKRGAS